MIGASGRARAGNVLLRAALTAIALVVVAFPAGIVAGAYQPSLPVVGRFGGLLNEGVAWVLGGALVATLACGLAVLLGGRRGAGLLLAGCLAVSAGAGAAAARMSAFAAAHGATFNVLSATAAAPSTRRPDERFTFASPDGEALQAEIWRPTGSDAVATAALGTTPAGGRPAVLFVHGGAFVGGELGARPQLFSALVEAGIVVVDIEYRLAPPPRWEDAPADVLCALARLGEVAAAERIDIARVVVVGESAGGSLALVAAYAAGTDRISSSCGGVPIVPAGVIAVAPAADLAGIWQDETLWFEGRPFPEAYIGGTPAELPERYAAASPFGLIRPGLPPTLLLAGENDRLVRLPRVTTIADQLKAAGVDARLLVVPFADHGFDGPPNSFGARVEAAIVLAFVAETT